MGLRTFGGHALIALIGRTSIFYPSASHTAGRTAGLQSPAEWPLRDVGCQPAFLFPDPEVTVYSSKCVKLYGQVLSSTLLRVKRHTVTDDY